VRLRQAKVDGIARDLPPARGGGPDGRRDLLVLGWAPRTLRADRPARRALAGPGQRARGSRRRHLRHLNRCPPTRRGAQCAIRPGGCADPERTSASSPADPRLAPGRRNLLTRFVGSRSSPRDARRDPDVIRTEPSRSERAGGWRWGGGTCSIPTRARAASDLVPVSGESRRRRSYTSDQRCDGPRLW